MHHEALPGGGLAPGLGDHRCHPPEKNRHAGAGYRADRRSLELGRGHIGTGADRDPRTLQELGEVRLQLAEQYPLLLLGRGEGGLGQVHHHDQSPSALDVAEELMTQSAALARTLDETRNVGDHEIGVALQLDYPQIGFQGRERVVGDLGLGRRYHRDQRGLPHVRESHQGDVSLEAQLGVVPTLLSHLALLGEARCPPIVPEEAGIATSAPTALGRQPPVALVDEVGDHGPFGIGDGRAEGNRYHEIASPGTVLAPAGPVTAVFGPAERVVTERQQRGHVVIGHQPDVAAVTPVAAVGTSIGDVGLPSERDAPGSPVATTHVDLGLVDEGGHRARIGAVPGLASVGYVKRHLGLVSDLATNDGQDVIVAHAPLRVSHGPLDLQELTARESESGTIVPAPLATAARGGGNRATPEEPDRFRTCFERDLDRVHHSTAFRRLAGKCQVFVAPEDDHLRTRLTHAVEVAQVAVSVARPLGLNVALTAATATAHDCGHGPAGHASEDALSPFLAEGYHHAVYGADVVLADLNLCEETLDGVRNHSWNRPAPATPEGEVVAWADRIAYLCHDFEDAVRAGIVTPADLPAEITKVIGKTRRLQLHTFITAMLETTADTGCVGMRRAEAEALAAFREFNYERIYLRPASVAQAERVIELLRSLTDWYVAHPSALGTLTETPEAGSVAATAAAVRYVSGMTDRFAMRQAVEKLGWPPERLPQAA